MAEWDEGGGGGIGEEDEGGVRLDEMDPDLFAGEDVDWWLDVLAVLTNGEMPPADEGEGEHALADGDRQRVIEWLENGYL